MRPASAFILSLTKLVPVSSFTTTVPLWCIQRHRLLQMASSHSKPYPPLSSSSIALSTPSSASLANSDDNEVEKQERKKNKEEEYHEEEEEGEKNNEETHEEEKLSKDKNEDKTTTGPPFKKVHTVTVCLVPPPKYGDLWETIGQMRLELKDPGFYRWPPHANLLYPFLQLADEDHDDDGNDNDGTDVHGKKTPNGVDIEETVQKLRNVTRTCSPFPITLDRFGTFGGAHRGVLWLSPESSSSSSLPSDHVSTPHQDTDQCENNETPVIEPPLITLQKCLQQAFPICNDQSRKGSGRNFTPHMTLSHFETLSDAQAALERLQSADSAAAGSDDATIPPFSSKSNNRTFLLDRIYLLQRKGDDGQFERVAEVFLGVITNNSNNNDDDDIDEKTTVDGYRIFRPSSPFPAMPSTEEDWVREERMALKARRNGRGSSRWGNTKRGAGRYSGKRRGRGRVPRVKDTPEVIARKRKERKAKRDRERREREEMGGVFHLWV